MNIRNLEKNEKIWLTLYTTIPTVLLLLYLNKSNELLYSIQVGISFLIGGITTTAGIIIFSYTRYKSAYLKIIILIASIICYFSIIYYGILKL